jgi:hypothetical protein
MIHATMEDVGKRVLGRITADAEPTPGTVTRVLSNGVVYVKWDWQQAQDAPMPTSEQLLDRVPQAADDDDPDDDDDDGLVLAGVAVAEVLSDIADAMGGGDSDSSDVEGGGGDFGGGGASADFSDE